MNTSIPKNIKRLRQKAGMTQEQLAAKMFVTRQTVSLWENGKTQPDIQTLERLTEVFEVDLREVLYGKHTEKNSGEQKRKTYKKWLIVCAAVWLGMILAIEVLYEISLQISMHDWPRIWYLLAGNSVQALYYYGLPASGIAFGGLFGWAFRKETAKPRGRKGVCIAVLEAAAGIVCGSIIICFRGYLLRRKWRWYFSVWLIAGSVCWMVWSILRLIERYKEWKIEKA